MTNVRRIITISLNCFLKKGYYAYSRNDKQKHVSTLSLQSAILRTQILW